MKYVALTGPAGAGKTILAAELETRGYMRLDFSRLLKELLITALASIGHRLSLSQIAADKPKYRKLLQEFGTAINFDNDPYFILKTLEPWFKAGKPLAVFDNVRTLDQYKNLYPYDFKLVQVYVSPVKQFQRAKALNPSLTAASFQSMMDHKAEQPLPGEWFDLVLNGNRPVEELAREVLICGVPTLRGTNTRAG